MSENINTDAIPEALKAYDNWVCWKYVDRSDGTRSKLPIDPMDREEADTSNPETWAGFDAAHAVASADKDFPSIEGIGFVVSEDDPFVGIDLDYCVDGEIADWAGEVVEEVDTYTEYSPSGTGLRAFVKGSHPGGRQRNGDVEMYGTGQYLTVTGEHIGGTPTTVESRQGTLETIHAEYVAAEEEKYSSDTTKREESHSHNISDSELLEKAKNASNGRKFKRLWNGDTSGYDSHSEADLALCSYLAFWTGEDRQQMDRLFRQSKLYREKWDRKHSADGQTYGEMTIEKAVESNDAVY